MAEQYFSLVTLGCSKNQVDSEVMASALICEGFLPTGELAAAEIIIVNTCGFIEKAREESIQAILELATYKKKGKCRILVAAGCFVQRHMKELRHALKEVDIFIALDDICQLGQILKGKRQQAPVLKSKPVFLYQGELPRFIEEGQASAYLKISEGCDNLCAYCAIPLIRGNLRSRPLPSIVREARFLMDRGIKELNIISHDCTAYGRDMGLEDGLVKMLEQLLALERFHWIRLLYLYPYHVPPALFRLMKEDRRLCSYLDVPMQHCNKVILGNMGRNRDITPVVSMIEKARSEIPEMTVRTTFIVGYPGETRSQFRELTQFCREMAFDRVGVFIYSPEEDTPAIRLNGHVRDEEKEERYEELMSLQRGIAEKKNKDLVGKTVEVLLEGYHPETDFLLRGRTAAMAPEVDGDVIINDGEGEAGEFVQVEVTEAYPYDLIGRIKNGAVS